MQELFADDKPTRAFLVAVQLPDVSDNKFQASVAEFGRLVTTLGMEVVGVESQKRPSFDAATYVGSGKVLEIKDKLEFDELDHPDDNYLVAVNNDITPFQARALSDALGFPVLDRTGVILEIFHRHAHSPQAKAQVELVRLAYITPRIRELRKGMTYKQRGAARSKGVGERFGELDRRRVRDRITELKAEIKAFETNQQARQKRRKDAYKVALVGYTNAGKSTFMRALTDSDVLVADKLFATLDTTVRMLSPAVEPTILVSDTVGFLKDLPHGLVASVKSTLEEALEASLLLHIVDASADDFDDQLKTTEQVLAEIEAGDIPTVLVFNKVDLIKDPTRLELLKYWPDALKVSAFSEPDVSLVHQKVCEFFFGEKIERWLVLRHDQGALRSELYDNCEVLEEISDHDGIKIRVLGHRFHIESAAKLTGEQVT